MVMAGEDSHQSIRVDKSFHERVVSMAIATNSAVPLMPNYFGIDTGCGVFGMLVRLLEGACGLHWDVHEGDAGDGPTILLLELITSFSKPRDDLKGKHWAKPKKTWHTLSCTKSSRGASNCLPG